MLPTTKHSAVPQLVSSLRAQDQSHTRVGWRSRW